MSGRVVLKPGFFFFFTANLAWVLSSNQSWDYNLEQWAPFGVPGWASEDLGSSPTELLRCSVALA